MGLQGFWLLIINMDLKAENFKRIQYLPAVSTSSPDKTVLSNWTRATATAAPWGFMPPKVCLKTLTT